VADLAPDAVGAILPGMANEYGKPVGVKNIIESERFRELAWRQSYGDCTQHDWKQWDFDGYRTNAGPTQVQPWLSQAQAAPYFVPLKARRPSSPMHLGRTISQTFTSLLFGEGRFPKVMVPGSQSTQDFYEAVVRASSLRTRMIQARTIGGTTGTAVLSWCFRNGKPRVKVHNPKRIWVHEWEDRDELKPAWASEIWRYQRDEWDGAQKKYMRKLYWYRRDWTPTFEVAWKPVPWRPGNQEPDWERYVDEARIIKHDDGFCHLVWIQNIPNDEAIDGYPDYHGQYDAMDAADLINSVLVRGTALNLDPTLVLKMDPQILRAAGLQKGSDHALAVGEEGSAEYLEISGAAAEAGLKVAQHVRKHILECAQCVVPDPEEIAASGTSSVAMKVIYRPTIAVGSVMREQYGERGVVPLLEQMRIVAAAKATVQVPRTDDDGNELDTEPVATLDLPPKITSQPKLDEDGNHTGEQETTETDHDPSEGGECTLDWGEWFPATPQDKQSALTSLSTAAGGKAIVSQQTAAEEAAVLFGRNPAEEWKRLSRDNQQQAEQEKAKMGMFGDGDAGGKVEPEGGKPNPFGSKPGVGKPFGGKPNPFAKKAKEVSEEDDGEPSEKDEI
jgi:hypothetical protein